jgi:hypothetical protein
MPSKSSKGPSLTLTRSPISKRMRLRGCASPFLHAVEDLVDLAVAHRDRLALGAQEAGDAVDRGDEVVGLVRHLHVDEDVARHEASLRGDLLAAAHLDDVLDRDQHLVDAILEALLAGLGADLLGDLLLEVRQDRDRVPAFRHACLFRDSWGHPPAPQNENRAKAPIPAPAPAIVPERGRPYARPARGARANQPPASARRPLSPERMPRSTIEKNTAATAASRSTRIVVSVTSRRVGQTTLPISARACWRNSRGFGRGHGAPRATEPARHTATARAAQGTRAVSRP